MFVRRDIYGRFYSCLIYLPRENYNTEVRLKLQDMLMKTFNGTSTDFNVQLSDSVLARVHLLVRTPPANAVQLDVKALEQQIAATVRRWEEGVFAMVVANAGEEAANKAGANSCCPSPPLTPKRPAQIRPWRISMPRGP